MSQSNVLPDPATATVANLTREEFKAIYDLKDLPAWPYSDEVLCAAALLEWDGRMYPHFTLEIKRFYHVDPAGNSVPHYMRFIFKCRHEPHKCHVGRNREHTSRDGTSNLQKAIRSCDKRRKVPNSLAITQPEAIPYSQLMFRVLLVIWCVVNHRPFHSIADPIFLDIVHMLRPEAVVPTPHTLSTDLVYIYNLASLRVREQFLGMECGVHLAIDGWSSPLTASFLGIVVFWRSGSTLWRSVLEFVHLTQSHSGAYLAEKTLECLERFGLRHHVISMCLDNASNNDVLVRKLADVLPNFQGSRFRGRCLAHIVNLIAKAFMAVFTRASPRKRKIAAIAREAAKRSRPNSSTSNTHDTIPTPSIPNPSLSSTDPNDCDSEPLDELDIALEVPGELVDEGMEQYDTVEVQKAVGIAIEAMAKEFGVRLSENELTEAQELFPKIVGFANDIHGSGTLSAEFQELRNGCRELLKTHKEMPTQRVETRWGADRACAVTHEELRLVIDIMTGKPGHKTAKYQLTTNQWGLLHEVIECLQVFDEPTRIHSQKNVPLIHLVLPHLRLLKYRLELMCNAVIEDPSEQPPSLVTRVAAFAALNVLNKYLMLLEDKSDIYLLATALCPWYKLQWFQTSGYSASIIQRVRNLLYEQFSNYTTRYGSTSEQISINGPNRSISAPTQTRRGRWIRDPVQAEYPPTTSSSTPLFTQMTTYLSTPPITEAEVERAGGLLKFWEHEEKAGSILGRMALDILTAPSSSVDAERAFSGGRMAVNYRQHRTSITTFRAKMAVGTWFGTPLLTDPAEVLDILSGRGTTEPAPLDLD